MHTSPGLPDPSRHSTRPEGLYQQVAQRVRQDITEGRYQPGDPLPSESHLSQPYHVSRQTVRQAIATLRSEGLVEVEQGRGTFVRRPPLRLPSSRYARHARRPGAGPFEAMCQALGMMGHAFSGQLSSGYFMLSAGGSGTRCGPRVGSCSRVLSGDVE
ncbi:MAG: GntR family transcriptional regulator, partial [Pseudonocardiaceae bacterium]